MSQERILHLPKSEDRFSFKETRQKLLKEHGDLPEYQLRRWEQFMIEGDYLAIGAIVAMMQVRDYRKQIQENRQVV